MVFISSVSICAFGEGSSVFRRTVLVLFDSLAFIIRRTSTKTITNNRQIMVMKKGAEDFLR